MGHKDHIQPALIGGGEDERRAGGQDDARPMYEQLDVIGDHDYHLVHQIFAKKHAL